MIRDLMISEVVMCHDKILQTDMYQTLVIQ